MNRTNSDFDGNDFGGLMGESEMEWAIARMVNLARHRGKSFGALLVVASDFWGEHDQDGFLDLVLHGWLERGRRPTTSPTTGALVAREKPPP
jgi:hypothetical protein